MFTVGKNICSSGSPNPVATSDSVRSALMSATSPLSSWLRRNPAGCSGKSLFLYSERFSVYSLRNTCDTLTSTQTYDMEKHFLNVRLIVKNRGQVQLVENKANRVCLSYLPHYLLLFLTIYRNVRKELEPRNICNAGLLQECDHGCCCVQQQARLCLSWVIIVGVNYRWEGVFGHFFSILGLW